MAYQVASLSVTVNGQPSWLPLHQKPIRKKAEAMALADVQGIHATVVLADTSIVVYRNGKPHGGKQVTLPRCLCPYCL